MLFLHKKQTATAANTANISGYQTAKKKAIPMSNHINHAEQMRAAKQFVARWQNQAGNEEEQSRSFWIELLEGVLGIQNITHVLQFERKVRGRKIDVFYEDMGILIEQKGRGISLDEASVRSIKAGAETPFQQAKWYADNLPYSVRPRWIITCNFDEFRMYDLNKEHFEEYVSVTLQELPNQLYLFDFFLDTSHSRLVKEKELSVQAGAIVGELYKAFEGQYKNLSTSAHEQRSLNVLIVRLVFLLYAEDAGLLHEHQAFGTYVRQFQAPQMREALINLFKVLDTPDGTADTQNKRDPYLSDTLAKFPYINGGLFAEEDIVIPQFTDKMRNDLIENASVSFDWKNISPTIFGAVFESTLNPQTRRSGGMHYTSIENIHKVIDPLFLNDLKAELTAIEGEKVERNRKIKLLAYQQKLANIRILDPACGSGNFLTESYLSLRRLENRVFENLHGNQTSMGYDEASSPICVGINQFYGIEINDFAVSVAKTALWIAEQQMMEQTQEIIRQFFNFLPLKSNGNIHEGNALRTNWNNVLPANQCTFLIGNPPFVGANNQSKIQKAEVQEIFAGHHHASLIDYVGCWYKKSVEYMRGHSKAGTQDNVPGALNASFECSHTKAAFVSTNSICQGEQVANLWKPLFNNGLEIIFAHKDFRWTSEAADGAHVFVSIIGFQLGAADTKTLFTYETPDSEPAKISVNNINAYLIDASSVFIERISKPLCNLPKMTKGCQPTDGGNLIIEANELNEFLAQEPQAKKFIKKLVGSKEFIQQKPRYCLWLVNATNTEIQEMPLVQKRVLACRDFRLSSPQAGTRKLAERCTTFRETYNPRTCLVVPKVSSERRSYIPIGFITQETISTDANMIVQEGNLFHFGVLHSQFHNAWMRVVCGRLKSDYRYSAGIVYNNFPWPGVTKENIETPVEQCVSAEVRHTIENCAQAVLNARATHEGASLADLYDPNKMPLNVQAAHKALDAAVEAAYGVSFNGNEEHIVSHLFNLYAMLTSSET